MTTGACTGERGANAKAEEEKKEKSIERGERSRSFGTARDTFGFGGAITVYKKE